MIFFLYFFSIFWYWNYVGCKEQKKQTNQIIFFIDEHRSFWIESYISNHNTSYLQVPYPLRYSLLNTLHKHNLESFWLHRYNLESLHKHIVSQRYNLVWIKSKMQTFFESNQGAFNLQTKIETDWERNGFGVGSGKRSRSRERERERERDRKSRKAEREREIGNIGCWFRISAFYNGVLGRRFYKNRRPVFWKSSAKIILGDDFWSRRLRYSTWATMFFTINLVAQDEENRRPRVLS